MTTRRRNRFPGFPMGWFVVAFSDELGPGDALSFRYFGQAQVVWRGEDGVLRAFDAHCPHMGADLGAGGKVVGDTIACPFHAWRFGADGRCVEIPYCDSIPKKAAVRTWHVREQNGLVHLWYHPERAEPSFDIPVLPNHGADDWLPWSHHKIRIATHSKEIVENVVDIAHFAPVHGTHVDVFENEFDRHMAIQRTRGIAYPRGGGKDRFELVATYYGPGFQVSDMKGYLHSLLINAHTMIDDHTLDLRFGVSIRPSGDADKDAAFQKAYVDNLTTGFLEDVQIWENKAYRDPPLLCAADGPIMKLRKWYEQFYLPEDADA